MSELEMPIVVTAIASAQSEGFIASTLFAQGWSVVFRALDWQLLENFMIKNPELSKTALLIYGSDLPGINPAVINSVSTKFRQTIGFTTAQIPDSQFLDLPLVPTNSADLVSLVRGFVRAPLLRTVAQLPRLSRRATVIAIGSAGSYTGTTLIAMNLAMELSNNQKQTLLIEANFRAPSICALLSMRNVSVDGSWKKIAPNLALYEITQDQTVNIDELMIKAGNEFDYVVVDIGSISGLSNRLTDRRWTSTMTTWCCDLGDELIVVARADYLGSVRLNQVIELLTQTSVRAAISFILNMKSPGKRGVNEQSRFLNAISAIKPVRVRSLAKDSRAVIAAEDERATLIETSERSNLRKSIAEFAKELQG